MTMDELFAVKLAGHDSRFSLTSDARDRLARYLDDARSALAADADRDEIVADLETAIGDRLAGYAAESIDGSEMAAVLDQVGSVGPGPSAVPRSEAERAVPVGVATRGRFFSRIKEGGQIGGVCLGIAAYGQFRIDWVRTVVLALIVVTGGVLGLAYLALMVALPVVANVGEYERMRDTPRTDA